MKLISMTEFVLQVRQMVSDGVKSAIEGLIMCERYANFLNQPLTLGMFIPTDLEGNVFRKEGGEILIHYNLSCLMNGGCRNPNDCTPKNCRYFTEQYQQAKERVLFSSVFISSLTTDEVIKWFEATQLICDSVEKIIDRFIIWTLTELAIKQIGL